MSGNPTLTKELRETRDALLAKMDLAIARAKAAKHNAAERNIGSKRRELTVMLNDDFLKHFDEYLLQPTYGKYFDDGKAP